MAHAITLFIVSVLIYIWVLWHGTLTTKKIWWIFIILGIASLVRWQNVLFGVIFLPQIQKTLTQWKKKKKFLKSLTLSVFIAIIGFIIAFSPQLIAWWEDIIHLSLNIKPFQQGQYATSSKVSSHFGIADKLGLEEAVLLTGKLEGIMDPRIWTAC